jgi:hypothetical protein
MKTRLARNSIRPSSVAIQQMTTPKLETATEPDQTKKSVMDTIIKEHKSRGFQINPAEAFGTLLKFSLYLIPMIVLGVLLLLADALQLVWLGVAFAILLRIYPIFLILLFSARGYLPVSSMSRELFHPTPVYLNDIERFAERVRRHINELKQHQLEELKFMLEAMVQYKETFAQRSKLLVGVIENLGLLPAVAAGIGAYIALVTQVTSLVSLKILPTTLEPRLIVGYGLVFFATIYLLTYSRRAAITNTLFNEHCLKQAIAELEAEENLEKEKLEVVQKNAAA